MSDYLMYRGRCKELSEQSCLEDSNLTLVRGHYYCPMWNKTEPHWWTVKPNGDIVDPSVKQFPSLGMGDYIPFDGRVACSECGKEGYEEDFDYESNYAFCSTRCHLIFVGLGEFVDNKKFRTI